MTRHRAAQALKNRSPVWGGKDEDRDSGHIVRLSGRMVSVAWADVAWDSGVRTQCALADLEEAP